jgi:hypothetical protein
MKSLALAALLLATVGSRAEVVIAEFVAENDGCLLDADGDSADWLELHNNGAAAVSLAGWALTDDDQQPLRWPLPDVTLAPDARLVIFASGKDRRNPAAELHTNFSISNSAGGFLALRKPDGTHASAFSGYVAQRADISFGDGTVVDAQNLVVATTSGKYLVPTSGSLGTAWTAPTFNDAGWSAATSHLGYQASGPGVGLPISYWTFDDTTANAIPTGPEATLVGATYNTSVPGAIGEGKSLHFTRASSTYVSADLDVSETAYSSSFWFRTTQANTGLFTVTQNDLGGGGYDRLLYLSGGNIFARTWNNETISSIGKNYADNQWHHVAHVVGASISGQRIYVDGNQIAAGVKAMSDFNWQLKVNLGFTNDAGTAKHHEGELDDLSIWSETLNTAAVRLLASGTAPDTLAGFTPYLTTNVQAAMRNVNPSLYLRLPFTVNRLTPFNQVTLKVRYDDGFVAYLDGVEVARRNAPETPAWNSTATLDRAAGEAVTLEAIDLSAIAGLLTNGAHVLAIQALNDAVGSAEFLLNAELSAATLSPGTGIYMDPPTPGTANTTGFLGFIADTDFQPKRGYYTTPQTVTISCATPGATIAYTIDGSDPSPTAGTQVPAVNASTPPVVAIAVTSTKYLRAMAYKNSSGLRPTNVDSHSYIFTPRVLTQSNTQAGYPTGWVGRTADYGMDPNVVNTTLPGYDVTTGLLSLPTISLTCPVAALFGTTAPVGIYYDTSQRGDAAERKVSLEWINPDGTPGWHVQAGVRPHGNSSRGHSFTPKHPLRLNFRADYGASRLREDIFGSGVKSFDQLLLRACSTDSMPVVDGDNSDGEQRWNNDKATYLRDQYMRDVLNDLGHPNCRGVYVQLYLNGLYWGLYNLSERPNAAFFASTFGGAETEWDVLKDFEEVNDGDAAAWNALKAIVNDTGITDAARCQKLLGNNPDGTRNAAYPIYLHWPSFRDYMIAHIAAGAEDWPDHNYWVGRRRGAPSDGFHFVVWDQEISNDSLTRLSGRGSGAPFESVGDPAVDGGYQFGPAKIYDKFRRVEPFKTLFRNRIHELLFNNGALTPALQKARWGALQARIDKAMVPESARWGDANGEGAKKRETTWLNNMNYMNAARTGYWDAIQPIDVRRFRNVALYPTINQPAFSVPGGSVPAGYRLYLTSAAPQIYYTLDGSDPQGANGLPTAAASLYASGIVLNQSAAVTARARTAAGEWSGVNQAHFLVGAVLPSAANVVISELHYHPAAPTRPSELAVSVDPDEFEFIELMNVGLSTVDFTGTQFTEGVLFDFPANFTLAPGGRCVVVRNSAAFAARYGTGRGVVGTFGYKGADQTGLSNGGETITLALTVNHLTTTLFSMTYDDAAPWPITPDGGGPSLVLKTPASSVDHSNPTNWIASADLGGSPGQSSAQMTFAQWRIAYRDSLTAGGDDDGDGIANALEYALLLNPLVRNDNALPMGAFVTAGDQRYLAISFRYRPAADLVIGAEASEALGGWSGPPEVVVVSRLIHGDGSVTETWRCGKPVGSASGSRQFLRLRAVVAP